MVRPLLALALLHLACTPVDSEDAPIQAWRRRLADPSAYPIREGMRIRDDVLRITITDAHETHRERILRRWDVELRALPSEAAPAEPEYHKVLALDGPPLETEVAMQLADRGVRGTLRRTLAMLLPIAMNSQLGMTHADVGRWLGFLSLAEPELFGCGEAKICMSYGGLDVFVFTIARRDGVAAVASIEWMQRPPG